MINQINGTITRIGTKLYACQTQRIIVNGFNQGSAKYRYFWDFYALVLRLFEFISTCIFVLPGIMAGTTLYFVLGQGTLFWIFCTSTLPTLASDIIKTVLVAGISSEANKDRVRDWFSRARGRRGALVDPASAIVRENCTVDMKIGSPSPVFLICMMNIQTVELNSSPISARLFP